MNFYEIPTIPNHPVKNFGPRKSEWVLQKFSPNGCGKVFVTFANALDSMFRHVKIVDHILPEVDPFGELGDQVWTC
jgi:hypothetical protein